MKRWIITGLGIAVFAAVLALPPDFARATWYSENVADGADIIMMDLRWPWWPSGTYYANWNTGFNPKPNNLTFYAGIQSWMADGPNDAPHPDAALQRAFRPGNTWSLWGYAEGGIPPRFVDVGPTLSMVNAYGGEGTSAFLAAMPWPFITNERWYTMLARVWQPPGGGDHAFCGRWIKDHADGRWHLVGIAWLPIPATSFHGNSGFIEPLTSHRVVRSLHRRFGYFRKNGTWQKADTIGIDKTVYVVVNVLPEDDHEYVAIEYAGRPDRLPTRLTGPILDGDKRHEFQTRQPDLPTLDKPVVAHAQALRTGSQVGVAWELTPTSSPALGYRIEVYENAQCAGEPIAVREEWMPSVRHALVAVRAATPTVRLTVIDIFDQAAEPVVLCATEAGPDAAPGPVEKTSPGLAYELFHQDAKRKVSFWRDPQSDPNEEHHWLALAELDQGRLVRQGHARGFDRSVLEHRNTGYAVKYRGRLRSPAEGLYILHAQIDGAYRVRINDRDVLGRDGQFGASAQAALVRLSQGDQTLEITHLFDSLPGLPDANFVLDWEGPGMSRRTIPWESLRIVDDGNLPSVAVAGSAPGDGSGRLTVAVEARGRPVNATWLFLGDLELASGQGAGLEFTGPLPEGESAFWSRIVYDDNRTADSAPFTLQVTGLPPASPWTVRNVGNSRDKAGLWQTGDGAFQFFGHGLHTVTQKATGDFSATVRVDACSGLKGEPVNGNSWIGVAAFEKGDQRNWNWGHAFYVVQTAGVGQRTSPDFGDGAGTRLSSYALPAGRPWLRIARQGDVWTAWTSLDGLTWELGASQFRPTSAEMDVGLFIQALKQESRAHFQARVSNLSVTPGLAAGCDLPVPPVARGTGGDRLTGVVMARSDARVVVVRSTTCGLLRTTDGGATWARANGPLAGSELAVRSVAIHPQNHNVMLRACGVGRGAGTLWKTSDGGSTWTKLPLPGDFDGAGPSALCGEVVAFDAYRPESLYAGTESNGFFLSHDGGETWGELKLEGDVSLAGQRITAVTQWPWYEQHPAQGNQPRLCLTTAGDRWMTFLGRGEANTVTQPLASRAIFSRQDMTCLQVAHTRTDTGLYNAVNDMAMVLMRGEMRFATTHGLMSEYWGRSMSLYSLPKNIEWMRPMTAMAAAALGLGNPRGRTIAQVLDPVVPGRYSRSHAWAFEWNWLSVQGDVPAGGLLSVAGDEKRGDVWWFVHTDGLYRSLDGGTTLTRVLDAAGNPSPQK